MVFFHDIVLGSDLQSEVGFYFLCHLLCLLLCLLLCHLLCWFQFFFSLSFIIFPTIFYYHQSKNFPFSKDSVIYPFILFYFGLLNLYVEWNQSILSNLIVIILSIVFCFVIKYSHPLTANLLIHHYCLYFDIIQYHYFSFILWLYFYWRCFTSIFTAQFGLYFNLANLMIHPW